MGTVVILPTCPSLGFRFEGSLTPPCFSSAVTLGVLVPLQAWASLHTPGLLLISPNQLRLLLQLQ